jgi:hypothetical protein
MHSRNFNTPKIKKIWADTETNKWTHRSKHQSETENTINREINELKLKVDNINEEVTHYMEKPQKKEWSRNTKHSGSPLQQTRTSRKQNLRTRRMNVNGLNSPIKRHHLANWNKNEDPIICVYRRTISLTETNTGLRWKVGRRFTKPMDPQTCMCSNTYISQSRFQTYIDQAR